MAAVAVDYRVQGEGPPLYMVHGIGSRKITWDGLMPHIAPYFTCVSYDLRGHGHSPVPAPPYSLDDLVEDLEALRGKLGHERIHVVGHSLGGMIGPAYARAYPERVCSLGLLSTAAGRSDDEREKLVALIGQMEREGVAPVLDTLLDRWYTDEFLRARPDVVEQRKQQVIDTPTNVFMSVFSIYATTEMGPWLHEIQTPCLVLTGELDGGCSPRLNRFIAGELGQSELVVLDGLKHSILMEAPDRVALPLKAFLLKHC